MFCLFVLPVIFNLFLFLFFPPAATLSNTRGWEGKFKVPSYFLHFIFLLNPYGLCNIQNSLIWFIGPACPVPCPVSNCSILNLGFQRLCNGMKFLDKCSFLCETSLLWCTQQPFVWRKCSRRCFHPPVIWMTPTCLSYGELYLLLETVVIHCLSQTRTSCGRQTQDY